MHQEPPSLALLAMEMRAFWEFGAVVPAWPALMKAPRGDGHTVIVFPGLAASDTSTMPLRGYLKALGYEVLGWEQGSNFGPRAGVMDAAREQVCEAAEVSGRKVSLVGWSLGGIYARELSKEVPEAVRCVVTLGTPFAGAPRSTHAWRIYEAVSGRKADRETEKYSLHQAPPVPTTSVFSRSDGIVAWQGSYQPPQTSHEHTENIEVVASHIGIGLNPSAWWAVADRLAQPQDQWKPFAKPKMLGLEGLVFPNAYRG
ncbi:MAG: alpha/beta hydrolase [Brachymonas sp.]|nr:alpha/beta hydrolase [Brachymonas sp.]